MNWRASPTMPAWRWSWSRAATTSRRLAPGRSAPCSSRCAVAGPRGPAERPADPRHDPVVSSIPMSSEQTRLLIVEDVPQVAQYIRGLLNSQSSVKLLDVLSDGSKVLPQVQQLRPDIVL